MLSGIFSVDTVGVGSSGAILGMLTAWIVWILFRWKKVPAMYHRQRNCQLGTVVIAVAVTIGLSFTPYVDWAAHVGGAIQGILWGVVVLSHELESKYIKWALRFVAVTISSILFKPLSNVLKNASSSSFTTFETKSNCCFNSGNTFSN